MDDLSFNWDDFEEQTAPPVAAQAPVEPEPATPETTSPVDQTPAPVAPPVQQEPAKPKEFGTLDWDTIEPSADYEITPPAPKAAEGGGPGWGDVLTSVPRGIRSGIGTTPDSVAGLADVVDDLTGAKVGETNAVSDNARELSKWLAGDDTIRNQGFFSSFKDPSDFMNYLGETVGAALGSTAAPVASAVTGGAAGTAVGGPAGGAVGATTGALSANLVMGIGQMRNALGQDPEIQKLLADGKITRADIAKYSIIGGSLMGGLEQVGTEKLLATSGVQTAFNKVVKNSLVSAIAKGGLAEGWTEAAQQIVQEATTVIGGGATDFSTRAMNVVENGIAGFFGGAGMHGVGHALPKRAEEAKPGDPANPPVEPTDPTQHEEAKPADLPGVVRPGTPDTGASTPGGIGANPPPPAVQETVPPAEVVPTPTKEKVKNRTKKKLDDVPITPAVVESGAPAPDVAAALGGAPASVTEPVQSPVLPEEEAETDVLTPEDLEDYFSPEAKAAAVERIRATKATGAVPAVPNADIAAALTARTGAAQEAAPAIPQVSPPVAGPSLPAAGPQEAISPPEATIPPEITNASVQPPMAEIAPVPEVAPPVQPPRSRFDINPVVEPEEAAPAIVEAPAALPLAPEPAAVEPQAVTSSPPAAAVSVPRAEIIRPAPILSTERAPVQEPAPVAEKPKPTRAQAAAVSLRDAARASLAETAPLADINEAVDQAVIERIADLEPGAAPGAVLREHGEAVTARAREILEEKRGKAEVEEAVKTEAAIAKSREQARETERAGKAKQGKATVAVEQEHAKSTQRAAEREMKKSEPAQWAVKYTEARAKLPGKGRGKKIEAQRKEAREGMAAAQAERVAELAAKPEPVAPKKPSVERREKAEAALTPVLEQTQTGDRAFIGKSLGKATRDIVNGFIERAEAAYKAAGVTPPERLEPSNSLAENIYVFAKAVMAKKRPDMNSSDVYTMLLTAQRGGPDVAGQIYEEMGESTSLRGGLSTEQIQNIEQVAEGTEFSGATATDEVQAKTGKAPTHPAGVTPQKTQSATQALNELGATAKVTGFGRLTQPFNIFRKMHLKKLKQLVGDVQVHIVSQEEMRDLHAQAGQSPGGYIYGSYTNYSDAMRAAGQKPAVYIDDLTAAADPETYANTLIHELTHAATSLAYRQDTNGTKQIIDRLYGSIRAQIGAKLTEQGMSVQDAKAEMGKIYGLTSPTEFIAEAYSNPQFQQMLTQLRVPSKISAEIRALTHGRSVPTWWDAFVATVQNAVGMYHMGGASSDYFSATIAVHPSVMLSSKTQAFLAKRAAAKLSDGNVPDSPLDIQPLIGRVAASADAQYLKDLWAPGRIATWARFKLATTFGLMEQADRVFGTDNNPFRKFTEGFLKKGARRRQLVEPGEELLTDILKTLNPKEIAEVSDFVHEQTLAQTDARHALDHPNNKHISKKGFLDRWRRKAHADGQKQWAAMTPEQQDAVNRLTSHYQNLENQISREIIRGMLLDMTEKYQSVNLPQGVSLDDAIDWVYDGKVDRKEDERDQFDKDMHKALGKHAESLAGSQSMRKIKGIYVPLVRNGKYVISGTHKVATPAGSVPLNKNDDNNQFVFHDKKKLQAYQDTTDDQISRVQSIWRDPATGERISKLEPQAVQEFVVTVQNKVVEMHDNVKVLERAVEEYRKQGYEMRDPQLKSTAFTTGTDILPRQLQRMLNSVRQMQPDPGQTGPTATQKGREAAIIDAYIRQLSGSRAQHRRLKRQGVKGHSRDLAAGFSRHNRMMAGYLTNLEMGREMAKHEAEMDKLQAPKLEYGKKSDFDALRLGELRRELATRVNAVENAGYGDGKAGAVRNAITGMTFLTHLWSPTYSLVNAYQPIATTLPELGKTHGNIRTFRMLNRALGIMGAGKSAWAGVVDSVKNLPGIFTGKQDFSRTLGKIGQYGNKGAIYNKVKSYKTHDGKAYGETMAQAIDALDEIGLGVDAGIETEIEQIGQNKAQRFMSRSQRAARAMPQVIEAQNRFITAIASVHLDLDKGVSPEQAVKNAVRVVEKTQGGYEKENNPAIFSNPVGEIALQFKKYAVMYGNLFGQNAGDFFDGDLTWNERRAAGKAVATMMLTTGLVAGAAGLPGMELAKFMVMGLYGLTGMSDDDWDDTVGAAQAWLASLIGAKPAEVATHGLPRIAGIDMSNRMGADSLLTFGSPKSYSTNDVAAWLFKNMSGAFIGAGMTAYGKIHDGKYDEALTEFMPKWASDAYKGYKLGAEGDVSSKGKKSGEPYSIGDVIRQTTGFSPAEKQRRWEPGGPNYEKAQKTKEKNKRSDTMGQWLNADKADREEIWKTVIQPYNEGRKGKERITKGDLIRNDRRRKTEERKAKKGE